MLTLKHLSKLQHYFHLNRSSSGSSLVPR